MYRVFFKDEYTTNEDDFVRLYKSFRSLFTKKGIKKLFTAVEYIEYSVVCNEDYELETYFNHSVEEKSIDLLSHLQVAFSEDTATIIEVDELTIDYVYNNSIKKYREERYFEISDFDHNNTNYILQSLKPGMTLQVRFNCDINDRYSASIKVRGTGEIDAKDIKTTCNVIQQNLTKHKNSKNKDIKLHVMYDHKQDVYSKYSIDELLNFVFIPYNNSRIPTVDIYSYYLEEGVLDEGVAVGYSTHVLQSKREVKVPFETLRRHSFCTGQTGAGKSSVLEMQVYDILQAKARGNDSLGLTLIDPKEGACIGVMNAIDKLVAEGEIEDKDEFMEKVIYVDLKHKDCNFGINILNKDVDTNELIDYFTSIFKGSGVQLERYIRHAVNLLTRDKEEHYIGDILKIFQDDDYRLRVYNRVVAKDGNDSESFFDSLKVEEFKIEKVDPIINRISPFVANEQIKKIFNSSDDLQIKKWIEEGYIVLFNFNSFSAPETQMIGGYISTKYYSVGMNREEGAHSHYLLIDEAHDLQVPVFEKIIAKLRSRGVHLWLYTQFLEQFNDDLLRAIVGNMTTKIILQQGTGSSKRAADIVKIDKSNIEEMKKQTAYLVTEDSSNNIVRTLVKTKPPFRYDLEGNILPYSSEDSEEDIFFKNNINKRNKQLMDELVDSMISKFKFKENTKHEVNENTNIQSEEESSFLEF